MLETIQKGFATAKTFLRGQSQLTESNIDQALKDVRLSLLEADVEYNVVKGFLERVRDQALGTTVQTSYRNKAGLTSKLSPAEHFIGICYQELEALMGPVDTSVAISRPIGSIMMVGLQGSGKTTTTGKLALYLKKKKFKPLLVAADLYRPAAIDQLQIIGKQIDVPVFSDRNLSAPALCQAALQKAKEFQCNVILFDTAGRLAIDEELMHELEQIKALTKPDSIFLVVDAMIGQDAVKTAAEFNRRLVLDGFILTKLDGDARGGAALSIKEVTGKPIKFLGMGEQLQNFEEFRPQGLASRILGMGDLVGLAKEFETHVDQDKAERDAERMLKGQFSLQDFLDQMRMIKKMGPLKDLVEKIPGMNEMMKGGAGVDEREFVKLESIVLSMTIHERNRPEIIAKQERRRIRIANGSGHKVKDVDSVLQRFSMMQKMMKMVGTNPGLLGRLPMFREMGQMAKLSQTFGQPGQHNQEMSELFRGMQSMGAPQAQAMPRLVAKNAPAKKSKRKDQKQARKKNKKRK